MLRSCALLGGDSQGRDFQGRDFQGGARSGQDVLAASDDGVAAAGVPGDDG